jgi:hypothetical protein
LLPRSVAASGVASSLHAIHTDLLLRLCLSPCRPTLTERKLTSSTAPCGASQPVWHAAADLDGARSHRRKMSSTLPQRATPVTSRRGSSPRSARTQPGWTATQSFTRENLDYPHAMYANKGNVDLPVLVLPARTMRTATHSDQNPFAATQSDWVTSLHAARVDAKQTRRVWPEYVPDSSASIGRRWFGSTLSGYREEGRLWDNSLGSSLDAHRIPTAQPRLKDIMQESIFPREGMSRGRLGGGGVLPRGHGGYWAS